MDLRISALRLPLQQVFRLIATLKNETNSKEFYETLFCGNLFVSFGLMMLQRH